MNKNFLIFGNLELLHRDIDYCKHGSMILYIWRKSNFTFSINKFFMQFTANRTQIKYFCSFSIFTNPLFVRVNELFYMSVKPLLVKPLAQFIYKKTQKEAKKALLHQDLILQDIHKNESKTVYVKEHNLGEVKNYEEFKQAVPIQDYEGLSAYFDLVKKGQPNVLWPGQPIYFAKTSGTTSGVKYI